MHTCTYFAAAALLLASVPAMAQPDYGPAYGGPAYRMARDQNPYRMGNYCATNSGQRDPNCIVADTGSSTYRASPAAGWNGISLWQATGR